MRKEDRERLRTVSLNPANVDVEFSKAMGVEVPEVDLLYTEIFNDLDDSTFGVGWWAPHPGTTRRILISHYLLECVRSIGTNLTEAALHHLEAVDYWERESDFLANCLTRDRNGRLAVQMPPRKNPEEDLPHRMATLHAVGFFRALVGSLDCLGASIIGVLALPKNLRYASLKVAHDSLEKAPITIQAGFREKLNSIITDAGPTGWLEWLTDFRNMVVHRGRRWHINQLLPRSAQILGPDGRVIPRMMVAEHLPSDPYRSQIEAFIDDARTPMLTEHAATTMRGSLKSSLHLIRNTAVELTEIWRARRQNPLLLSQPRGNWPEGICRAVTGFTGYEPGSLPYDPTRWVSNPDVVRQFRTAALSDDLRHRWKSFD